MLYLDRIYTKSGYNTRYKDLLSAYSMVYFDVKRNFSLRKHKSRGKKSKMIQRNMKKQLNLKQKGQIRKSKQISNWSTLNPNILNKTAVEPSLEDSKVFSSNTQTETSWEDVVYKSEVP